MVNIYILSLCEGKFYVGKTTLPASRIDAHFQGKGSAWTRRYPPIAVLGIISNCSDFDEDRYTKELMARHGVENVRGGSYTQMTLDAATLHFLEREMRTASDVCLRCGRKGHFFVDCFAKTHVDGRHLEDTSVSPTNMVASSQHTSAGQKRPADEAPTVDGRDQRATAANTTANKKPRDESLAAPYTRPPSYSLPSPASPPQAPISSAPAPPTRVTRPSTANAQQPATSPPPQPMPLNVLHAAASPSPVVRQPSAAVGSSGFIRTFGMRPVSPHPIGVGAAPAAAERVAGPPRAAEPSTTTLLDTAGALLIGAAMGAAVLASFLRR